MGNGRVEHLQMIQDVISRMALCSFQLKGWAVTLAAALEVFLQAEAGSGYLFVPALPVVAFWLLDAWYLRQERLFRKLFDDVRLKDGPPDFSMNTSPFAMAVPSTPKVAAARTILGSYGPVLVVVLALAFILPA